MSGWTSALRVQIGKTQRGTAVAAASPARSRSQATAQSKSPLSKARTSKPISWWRNAISRALARNTVPSPCDCSPTLSCGGDADDYADGGEGRDVFAHDDDCATDVEIVVYRIAKDPLGADAELTVTDDRTFVV